MQRLMIIFIACSCRNEMFYRIVVPKKKSHNSQKRGHQHIFFKIGALKTHIFLYSTSCGCFCHSKASSMRSFFRQITGQVYNFTKKGFYYCFFLVSCIIFQKSFRLQNIQRKIFNKRHRRCSMEKDVLKKFRRILTKTPVPVSLFK